jgi:hypothetical protein
MPHHATASIPALQWRHTSTTQIGCQEVLGQTHLNSSYLQFKSVVLTTNWLTCRDVNSIAVRFYALPASGPVRPTDLCPRLSVPVFKGEGLILYLYNGLFNWCYTTDRRSQWPRSLRHELSLPSLESWDRGFESHSSHGCLYTFILFVLFCV